MIDDEPTPEQLRAQDMDEDETLYGLYEGVPATAYGADWASCRTRSASTAYPWRRTSPILTPGREVRRTVIHEVAHHAGLGHARLRETRHRLVGRLRR